MLIFYVGVGVNKMAVEGRRKVKWRRYVGDRDDLLFVVGEEKSPQDKDWRRRREGVGKGQFLC